MPNLSYAILELNSTGLSHYKGYEAYTEQNNRASAA